MYIFVYYYNYIYLSYCSIHVRVEINFYQLYMFYLYRFIDFAAHFNMATFSG